MSHKTALTPAESIILPGAESGNGSGGFERWAGSVRVNGANVRYDLYEPESPTEETPILINNGYCAPAIVYDALAVGLAEEGRSVVRYHPPRHVGAIRAMTHGHFANPLKKHTDASEAVMLDVIKHTGSPKIDILGHSMGTPISLRVATESPEAVRSIMTTGGAGLDSAGGIVLMGLRSLKLFKREILDEMERLEQLGEMSAVAREVFEHIALHPYDTLAEGYYVSRINVVPDLQRAKAFGIRVGALIFEYDSLFNADNIVEHVGDEFDYLEVIRGAKHIHPQLEPRRHAAEQVAASTALNALELTPKAA